MIKWTFYFNEGHVQSEITTEDEDDRIVMNLYDPDCKWLDIPGPKMDLHINLDLVKVITREIVDESANESNLKPDDQPA